MPSNNVALTPNARDKACEAILAKSTDEDATSIIVGDILWCASSIAKRIPEIGAPVATEKPAHAPPVIEYLSHALCFPLVKIYTLPRPIDVPI